MWDQLKIYIFTRESVEHVDKRSRDNNNNNNNSKGSASLY